MILKIAEFNQLYDVKICVRSSVKLLEEIKLILEKNPKRERLFRRTIFGRWFDILSHDNDNHLMHYVLQHQDSNPILELYATPSETKESWFVASINFTNGLVNEDMNVSQDEGVGVVSLLLKGGDGVLDSDRGVKNPNTDKDKQATMAEILALRKEVALVKGDDERIAKLERLVNQIVVNQGKGSSSNDLMSTCSRPDIDNVKVVDDGSSSNDPMSSCSHANIDNSKVVGAGMGIDNFDGKNDIPNENHNAVNQGFGSYANDPMLSCSRADMVNGKVACFGIGIDKVDGMNDIPNLNHNCVNQGKGGSANDPMSTCSLTDKDNGEVACDGMVIDKADGKNEYTYSQRVPSTLDILIKALDYANDNPGIDVLQHDNDVDRSVAELNHHPTADIHVEPVHVYDFVDDYMSVLNDEEHEAKYSLDEMKLIDEEEKLVVKDPPVKHVDAFIDEQEDKTTMSVKERKKRLVMSLDSPYGQQATTTPSPPKTRSQNPPEYRFPWSYRDIAVTRAFWLVLACLDPAKDGWLHDSHLDLWVDQMWYFRHPDADWAMVYFPVNEQKKHWCLAELHISSGVVTFYDTLGYVCGNRRPWWRKMKRNLPHQLALYLNEHGVLESKGISVESLSRNLLSTVKDPLQTALAYRERILEYFWRHKTKAEPSVLPDEGHTLSYNTSSLDGRKYSSLALEDQSEDQSLDHLETKLYD
ncbi:phospholipase-like protein [Tanacetum coccineum]